MSTDTIVRPAWLTHPLHMDDLVELKREDRAQSYGTRLARSSYFPDSQHPDQYGWPAHGVGPFDSYSFNGFDFASGVAAGTGPLWDLVSALIVRNGTLLAPSPTPPLTQGNVNDWNFWGQEDRQSRNSGLWSIHSWGLANDYNSAYNPNRSDSPPAGPYRLPPNLQQLLDDYFGTGAFLFGGGPTGWGDWMHVECHMSPNEVTQFLATHQGEDTVTTEDIQAIAAAVAGAPISDANLDRIVNRIITVLDKDPGDVQHSILEGGNDLNHKLNADGTGTFVGRLAKPDDDDQAAADPAPADPPAALVDTTGMSPVEAAQAEGRPGPTV